MLVMMVVNDMYVAAYVLLALRDSFCHAMKDRARLADSTPMDVKRLPIFESITQNDVAALSSCSSDPELIGLKQQQHHYHQHHHQQQGLIAPPAAAASVAVAAASPLPSASSTTSLFHMNDTSTTSNSKAQAASSSLSPFPHDNAALWSDILKVIEPSCGGGAPPAAGGGMMVDDLDLGCMTDLLLGFTKSTASTTTTATSSVSASTIASPIPVAATAATSSSPFSLSLILDLPSLVAQVSSSISSASTGLSTPSSLTSPTSSNNPSHPPSPLFLESFTFDSTNPSSPWVGFLGSDLFRTAVIAAVGGGAGSAWCPLA